MRGLRSIALSISLGLLIPSLAHSQSTVWAGLTTYGGTGFDWTFGMDIQRDFIVQTIFSTSYQAVPSTGVDFIVMLNNPAGGSYWETVIGKADTNEWTYDVAFLEDGNAVAVGVSCVPNSGSPTNCSFPGRGFVIKLDRYTGNIIFAKEIIDDWGYYDDWVRLFNVEPTSDGGFVVVGEISYIGSDYDVLLMKFDSDGNLQWNRILGTAGREWATSIFQISDGDLIVIAPLRSEIWMGKLNITDGSIIWQKTYSRDTYGPSKYFSWAYPTSDGGFILADEIDGGTSRDILFIKFDSYGNVLGSFTLGTTSGLGDVGVDAVEGTDYYYFTGFIRDYDVPIVYVDKTTLQPTMVRYILSAGDEQGRAIDVNTTLTTEVPYVAGYTDNAAWTAGYYDGLLAADSGTVDTCYWRTAVDTAWSYLSIYPSIASWNDYGTGGIIIQDAIYYQGFINTSNSITCGLLTPLDTDERYEDCRLGVEVRNNMLIIRAKASQDISLKIYNSSGRLIMSRVYRDRLLIRESLNLKPGTYIFHINDLRKKFVIR